jgi:hypothetical protein
MDILAQMKYLHIHLDGRKILKRILEKYFRMRTGFIRFKMAVINLPVL